MITVTVTFRLSSPLPKDEMKRLSLGTAERYREIPDLIRKYYVQSDDGATVAAVARMRSTSRRASISDLPRVTKKALAWCIAYSREKCT